MSTRVRFTLFISSLLLVAGLLAGAQARGGDLVIAIRADAEPASLDYHVDPFFTASLMNTLVSDQLLFLHPETNEYEPFLATGWEVSDDDLSWTFTLRDDVTFQDGTPFNAEAVKFNIERIKAPETASALAADILGPITAVEVVDEFTVRFDYDAPFATLDVALARIPMWSPEAVEAYGLEDFDNHLVGTGPFQLTEWVPNSHVRMERWDDYNWGPSYKNEPGPVHLDSVTFRFVGEQTVLGSIVTTDEANVVSELPPQFIADFRDDPNYQLRVGLVANTGIQLIGNVTRAPLDNQTVRQALRHAVSTEIINNLAYDGEWAELYGPLNQGHPCYWEGVEEVYPYDPERAQEMLEGAGWVDQGGSVRVASGVEGVDDGTPLELTIVILGREEIAEAIDAMLRQVGVGVAIEVVPGPVQLERAQNKDFNYIFQRLRGNDGNLMSRVWNSKNDRPGGWAWSGLRDDELDAILDEIEITLDFETRCELAVQAQQIVTEHAAHIPSVDQPTYWVLNNEVMDFTVGPEGNWFTIYNTYIEE